MISRKSIFFPKIISISLRFIKGFTARATYLQRDFTKPESISLGYWKKLIWVAMDLKQLVREKRRKNLRLLDAKHITLLFTEPEGRLQIPLSLACDLLGARNTFYLETDFENLGNPSDCGKELSRLTDMLITNGLHQDVLLKLASSATIPLFSLTCNLHALQKGLSDLMTVQEKFKRLRNLTLAWVGPPVSIFNTYLILGSQFGMKIRYLCICKYGFGRMSPVHQIPDLEEYKSVEECVAGANVIVTSTHSDRRSQINVEALAHAEENWSFIQSMPRGHDEVSDDIFNHKQNLTWDSAENCLYIAMAVILTNLHHYEPEIRMPDFDGVKTQGS